MALQIIRRGTRFAVADGATLLSFHDTFQAANEALSALGCGAVEALFANHESNPIRTTVQDCRLGSQARAQARGGRGCPDWVANETLWQRAVWTAAHMGTHDHDEIYPTAVACYRVAGGAFANREAEGGNWVTMRGSPVFIKDGQSPMEALQQKLAKNPSKKEKAVAHLANAEDQLRDENGRWSHGTLEQTVNYVIKHGPEIQERMSGLGTIWPTKEGLAKADAFSDQKKAEELTEAAKELAGLEKRTVGGEVRYYKTPAVYTTALKRGGKRRWFETRKDGYDYAIKLGGTAANADAGTSLFVAAHFMQPVGAGIGMLSRKRWQKKPNAVASKGAQP